MTLQIVAVPDNSRKNQFNMIFTQNVTENWDNIIALNAVL